MFAGSVFDLAEDTEYEVRFTLTDPDGVTGDAERIAHVRTRAEPSRRRRHGLSRLSARLHGPKQQPAFTGSSPRTTPRARRRLEPRLSAARAAGRHDPRPRRRLQGPTAIATAHEIRTQYGTCCGTPWDGTYYLTQNGTAEKPIAIKAAGDGEVDLRRRRQQPVQRDGRRSHYFEGLTFRNTDIALSGRA